MSQIPVIWWVVSVIVAFCLPAAVGMQVSKAKGQTRDQLVASGFAGINAHISWKTQNLQQISKAQRQEKSWKTGGYVVGSFAAAVTGLFFPFIYFLFS